MEQNYTFDGYTVAKLESKNQVDLSSLEKTICDDTNKHIVLIAYEEKDSTKG